MFNLKKLLSFGNRWNSREYLQKIVWEYVCSANTMGDVLDAGLRNIFEEALPKRVAADLCAIVMRMEEYTYEMSTYRRSYRSAAPVDYYRKLLDLAEEMLFDWKNFDLIKYLTKNALQGRDDYDDNNETPNYWTLSMLIALKIDRNDAEVIDAVRDVILSENNARVLTHEIIRAVAMCHNAELHELMKGMLLAAKLQEGLRQAILETADDGVVEYFIMMIKTTLDNDLLRYSSALRAVCVWMGIGYDYSDKRVIEKLLRIGYECLVDENMRAATIGSEDVAQMYAAMWAASVFSIQNLNAHVERYMSSDKKYQKMISAYFLKETGSVENSVRIAGEALHETDMDTLALILLNYSLKLYQISESNWNNDEPKKISENKFPQVLKNKAIRDSHFSRLAEIIQTIPKTGHTVVGKPFDWCNFTLTRGEVYETMMALVLFDRNTPKQRCLVELSQFAEPNNKCDFLQYFVFSEITNKNLSAENRNFLFNCLADKSMPVRTSAVKMLKNIKLDEAEILKVEELFALKTGEIRQNALQVVRNGGKAEIMTTVKRLITDKNELKRLAALDLLLYEKKSGNAPQNVIRELIETMPKTTETETIIINNLLDADAAEYSRENGFGLYDVEYFPDLPAVVRDENYNLKKFRNITTNEMTKVFDTLLALIHKNKDLEFTAVYCYSSDDYILGNVHRLHPVVKVPDGLDYRIEDYVLGDVWRKWLEENTANLFIIMKIAYCEEVSDYDDNYKLDEYKPPVRDLIKKHLGYDEIKRFLAKNRAKNYYTLAQDIIETLFRCLSKKIGTFSIRYGILADFFLSTEKTDWENLCCKEDDYRSRKLANITEIEFFLDELKAGGLDEYKKKLSLCYAIGAASGNRYEGLEIDDIAHAFAHGIVERGELCRAVMEISGSSVINGLTGSVAPYLKETAANYPALLECVADVARRVIEIELKRGDTKTPVSHLANAIERHEGAEVFSNILVALGKETLVRGYTYGGDYTKRDVLSSLLKTSVPDKRDDAETLRNALNGRIAEKRLLEAAMYAPSWIAITEDYLAWEGLKCAAWYFHAHTRNSYSSEFETEVARFSPIDKEDFQRGAFDVKWFKEAYETVGAERFNIIYDCAKYISDGATHRRAQLFADAVLGKLSIDDLEPQIRDKRNKDLLLSYSLAPFGKNKIREALRRYEFINEFLKKSREFGAQRQASEKEAAGIALENLARNLGYDDVLRFNWKMELEKSDAISAYFQPRKVGDAALFLEMETSGLAALAVEKDGKRLKSVPAAIKKDVYVKEINEVKQSLKAQFSRARVSLERAMEKQDAFTFADVSELLQHPVICPIIKKLVFRSDDELGFIHSNGLTRPDGSNIALKNDAALTIAHCHDLFALEKWLDFQRHAFDAGLIQPFKQIFRELYTVNDDEHSAKTVSRRYAGHQIQPRKAVALLKGRGWTVDYESGLQKVYYRENIIARMYAMADWFSPSDIEAPTLETVEFYERKTGKPLSFDALHPTLFSEVMRDVDLVVSVAHVGGVDPMASHSTIEMRAVILSESVRLLKLANVTITDRHARIKGSLAEYSIHLGSGIAHIAGRGALNILPVHSQHRGRIFLPFMDEDPKTAEIVAKTLLLAEDEKIKDPTVMRQIV